MSTYTIKPPGPDTWDAFAQLAERHNGVWGGCWCTWFHPRRAVQDGDVEPGRPDKERAGGGVAEAYPHDTQGKKTFLYNGARSLFEEAGFSFERTNCLVQDGFTQLGTSGPC